MKIESILFFYCSINFYLLGLLDCVFIGIMSLVRVVRRVVSDFFRVDMEFFVFLVF